MILVNSIGVRQIFIVELSKGGTFQLSIYCQQDLSGNSFNLPFTSCFQLPTLRSYGNLPVDDSAIVGELSRLRFITNFCLSTRAK